MKIIKIYIRLIDGLNNIIGRSVSVLLPAMVLVLAIEVVARYIFKSPTLWAYDIAIFMFGYTGLLAGGHVLRVGEHVNVDIIYASLSPRRKAIADVVTGPLFFFFMILLVIYTSKTAVMALEMHEKTPTAWGPPMGHFKLMMPIGGMLLLLQGSAMWIRNLYKAITNKDLET